MVFGEFLLKKEGKIRTEFTIFDSVVLQVAGFYKTFSFLSILQSNLAIYIKNLLRGKEEEL